MPLQINLPKGPPEGEVVVQELWGRADTVALDRLQIAFATDDLAMALLAIEHASSEAVDATLNALDAWAALLPTDTLDPAHALRALLCEDLGFAGDTEDYDHPRNSSLTAVIERRRGLPILLTSLWVLVGRRAGFDVQGIGMPGHFLVSVDGDLLDPFDQGRLLSPEDCRHLFLRATGGSLPWEDAFLDPITFPRLVERVLWNLVNTYNRRNDAIPFYRHARLLAELFPDRPQLHMIHATAAEAAGAYPLALDLLRHAAARFGHTPLGRTAARRADRLQRTLTWVH